MTFDAAVTPIIEDLKQRWPLKNGKHIYTDNKDFQWELTPLRLAVWARHIVCSFVLKFIFFVDIFSGS
jgi:hypothetical protein